MKIMTVQELNLPEDTVTYLGSVNASAFFWIGRYKDIPKKHLTYPVMKMYDRTFGYAGKILLCECEITGNCQYWNWHEVDPDVPDIEGAACKNLPNDGAEALFIAMFRSAGKCYAEVLRREIGFGHHSKKYIESVIQKYRYMNKDVLFLKGTNMGDYILRHIEDRAIVRGMCKRKEWNMMDHDAQTEYLEKGIKKLQEERAREAGKKRYAKIKGRSVNHDTDR